MTRGRPGLSILDAVADDKLFAPWFKDRATWNAWSALLAALFGLPLTDEQLAIYRKCTGRDSPPTEPANEGWLICGRRAGKSFVLALIAVYLATFPDYRRYLSPGERGTVLVIATDRKQARTIFRYIRGLLTQVPMLAKLVPITRYLTPCAPAWRLSQTRCCSVPVPRTRGAARYGMPIGGITARMVIRRLFGRRRRVR